MVTLESSDPTNPLYPISYAETLSAFTNSTFAAVGAPPKTDVKENAFSYASLPETSLEASPVSAVPVGLKGNAGVLKRSKLSGAEPIKYALPAFKPMY